MLVNGTRASSFRLHNPFFKTYQASTQTTPAKPMVDTGTFTTPSLYANIARHNEQCVLDLDQQPSECTTKTDTSNGPRLEYRDAYQQTLRTQVTSPLIQDVAVGSSPMQMVSMATQASPLVPTVLQTSSTQTSPCHKLDEKTPDLVNTIHKEFVKTEARSDSRYEDMIAKLSDIENLLKTRGT